MCSNTHVLFMMSVYSLAAQAGLWWVVAPDSIPASRSWWLVRAVQTPADGLWSESVDALQTRSHTCCLCTTRGRGMLKKKHFFFPLHPDSALWSTLLSLHLSFHLHLKSQVSAAGSSVLSPAVRKALKRKQEIRVPLTIYEGGSSFVNTRIEPSWVSS